MMTQHAMNSTRRMEGEALDVDSKVANHPQGQNMIQSPLRDSHHEGSGMPRSTLSAGGQPRCVPRPVRYFSPAAGLTAIIR
jgi:hypothetical protein